MLALDATARGRFKLALGWMALAVVVDSFDGSLARRVRIANALPSIDGTLLDNLVDFVTYVFVPAFLIHRAGLLPPSVSLAGAAAIVVASAFQFTHAAAKTADHFRGFPSYWNIVAFYLLLLRPDPRLALGVVGVLAGLIFVPVPSVYPTRTRTLRGLTLGLGAVWAGVVVYLLWRFPRHPRALAQASLLYPVYYTALSFWLWRAGVARGPRSS